MHPYENMSGSLFYILVARLTIYKEVFRPRDHFLEETIGPLIRKAAPNIRYESYEVR
jgi:hypothetical protein